MFIKLATKHVQMSLFDELKMLVFLVACWLLRVMYERKYQVTSYLSETQYWDLRGKVVETECLIHQSIDYFDSLAVGDKLTKYEQSKGRQFFTMDDEFAVVQYLSMKGSESYWKFLNEMLIIRKDTLLG